MKEITVGGNNADINGFTEIAIQAAVEALARRGGGTVRLSAGTFDIAAPIRLYSNITLIGSGEQTVLRKIEGVVSKLSIDPGFGQLWVDVEQADGFRPGMGILVNDTRNPYGWDESTAVITDIVNDRLFLSSRLINNYDTEFSAAASNACSIIEAVGVESVVIQSLVIEGNKQTNEYIGGCRGGGVYLCDVTDSEVKNIKVMNFNGDGISWQITERVRIEQCEVVGCTGSGLHPGSRSEYSEIISCSCHDNGEDGIFICWAVQHGTIENNRFCNNGRHGISIGHQDTDNWFKGNTISGNSEHGVYARQEKEMNGAHRNRFEENTMEDNGQGEGAGMYIEGVTKNWQIVNNSIRSIKKKQKYGIVVKSSEETMHYENNQIEGHEKDV